MNAPPIQAPPPPVQQVSFPKFPAIASRVRSHRPMAIFVTHMLSVVWFLLPLTLLGFYGPERGMAFTHWVSTGSMPLPMGNNMSVLGSPVFYLVYLRFCLPMALVSLVAEVLYGIRKDC